MINKEILNQGTGLSQAEIPEISTDLAESEGFEEIGKEKIEALKEAISDVKILIKERKALSQEILIEGEKLKTELNNFLLENDNPELTDHDALMEKNNLRAIPVIFEMLLGGDPIPSEIWFDDMCTTYSENCIDGWFVVPEN